MRRPSLLAISLLLGAMGVRAAENKEKPAIDAQAAFTRLKTLAGEWAAQTEKGRSRVTYEVIAGGASLVERESLADMPDMMTIYHMDGGRLMMTHYCAAGNQPRMEARSFDPKTGEIRFEFLDATNLASKDAGHMHNATLRVTGREKFRADWEYYEKGRPKFTESFDYTRVR